MSGKQQQIREKEQETADWLNRGARGLLNLARTTGGATGCHLARIASDIFAYGGILGRLARGAPLPPADEMPAGQQQAERLRAELEEQHPGYQDRGCAVCGPDEPVVLAPLDSEEGWTFWSGVPDGVEDGHFAEELATFGPVPAEPGSPGSGASIAVTAHDGKAFLAIDGDPSFSLAQAPRLVELLGQAIRVLEGYQPKSWMRDEAQLHQRKVEADQQVYERALRAAGRKRR